jgi:hypothetical protein
MERTAGTIRAVVGETPTRRRFTRLTNAFSKKVDNHKAAVALYFMHYNFARIHKTLRVTPAMEAGVSDHSLGIGRGRPPGRVNDKDDWVVALEDSWLDPRNACHAVRGAHRSHAGTRRSAAMVG